MSNECVEAGCVGACCYSIKLDMKDGTRRRYFPGLPHFRTGGKQSKVFINGPCPQLDTKTSDCMVWEDPDRPQECSSIQKGGRLCQQRKGSRPPGWSEKIIFLNRGR